MKLSYNDLLGDRKRRSVNANITTEHALSSYGQPVLLLEDGKPLDFTSWTLMAYQIEEATEEELEMMKTWLSWLNFATENDRSRFFATLGSAKSERKAKTSAENGRKGGRPKKQ